MKSWRSFAGSCRQGTSTMTASGRPNPRRKWEYSYSFVWMAGRPSGTSSSNTIQSLDAAGWDLVSMSQTVYWLLRLR